MIEENNYLSRTNRNQKDKINDSAISSQNNMSVGGLGVSKFGEANK
jgi:hypothetical protein